MAFATVEKRRAYYNSWHKEQYANNPVYKRAFDERKRRRDKRRNKIVNAMLAAFRAEGCCRCEEMESCCLVAHHIDPSEKDFNLGSARYKGHGRKRVMHELAKCVCLCANCHAKLHAKVITISLKTLRVLAQRAFSRVAAVEAEATAQVAVAVRLHHAGRKRRKGLSASRRRNQRRRDPEANGFKLPLALVNNRM